MRRALLFTFAIVLAALGDGAGADNVEIKPPFKLEWNMSVERIERMLNGAKLKVIERKEAENGLTNWTVEGFPPTGPRRVIFGFRRGQFVQAELQYQRDDWDEARYDSFMGDLRRTLERSYGPGQLIARKTEQADNGEVTQTVVGY